MRHRVAQVRQVIGSQLDLRWNDHRRLSRELGIVVAHHHHRRSDLLHRLLGQFALRRLEFIAIAATTAATRLCLGRLQWRNIVRRNQGDSLVRLGDLLHHSSAQKRDPMIAANTRTCTTVEPSTPFFL